MSFLLFLLQYYKIWNKPLLVNIYKYKKTRSISEFSRGWGWEQGESIPPDTPGLPITFLNWPWPVTKYIENSVLSVCTEATFYKGKVKPEPVKMLQLISYIYHDIKQKLIKFAF